MGPIVIDINPVLFQIGHFAVRWYGLAIAAAIVAGFFVASREARRRGIAEDAIQNLGLWAVVAGVVGARLFHVVDRWPFYLANPMAILNFQEGGLAIFGAIIGGVAGGAFYAWRSRLPIARVADVAVPALILGQAIPLGASAAP